MQNTGFEWHTFSYRLVDFVLICGNMGQLHILYSVNTIKRKPQWIFDGGLSKENLYGYLSEWKL